jgi:signal transduction histidine kinase
MSAIDWSSIVPPWLAQALPAGILVTDTALTIRHWCAWLEARSGRGAAELVGSPLLDAFPDLAPRGLEAAFRRALAGETVEVSPHDHDYLLALPGPMVQRARIAPLRIDGVVAGTISTIVDMSESAAAIATAEEALRRQDAFFSLAAHELRTPLTALLGRIQLLQKWLGENGDERIGRSLGIMYDQARRLNTMITTLLEVSRIQMGRLKLDHHDLDLAALTRQAVADLLPAGTRPVVLAVPEAPVVILGDRPRLEQVVRSLLANAVRYSPNEAQIQVLLASDAGEARLSVADHGIGIPADDLPYLFTRPFRAKNAERLGHKGLGADLFVAGRIADLHGGSIAVESVEGQGSTFTVRLPLSRATTAREPAPGGDRQA